MFIRIGMIIVFIEMAAFLSIYARGLHTVVGLPIQEAIATTALTLAYTTVASLLLVGFHFGVHLIQDRITYKRQIRAISG